MGGKGSPPPAPDYVGAAQQQAEASREITNIQNFANRPTINTPFGSQSWQTNATTDPATGQTVTQWTQNTSLAPELQNALDSQLALQQGRSQLAEGFMGRVADAYAQPLDYSSLPQRGTLMGPGNLQTQVTPTGVTSTINAGTPLASVDPMIQALRTNTPTTSVGTNFDPMASQIQRGVQSYGLNANFDPMTNNLVRTAQTESVQRALQTDGNPPLPQFDSSYRDTVARSLMERMVPVHERQQNALETQLANQGFNVGTEGYKRALDELQQRQASERYNALDMAGQEAQRLFNMGMGSRQQAFSEDVTGGQFANQAAQQAYQQALSSGQFQNQAAQQAYQQAMGAQQAGNQALNQQFQQNLAGAQFGNAANAQGFQQSLAAQQAANQAQGQAFQQGLAANQFANQAANQAFQQNLGAAQFANQAQNQLYGQQLGQAELANRAGSQAFQQNLAAGQFGNQALGQQFNMNMQMANAQNALRQQAIAEEMQRRGMSLNEMNALLSGQQVGMPQMPTFNTASRAETPNILGATQMGYDAALGAYNAQQAAGSNMLGGLFQMGAAAAPFMFSDRRLKRNIKRIGTHPIGVGIYEYTMLGYPQVGVMAQELQAVRPDLVKRHQNGYLMVNYGGLK